MRYEDYLRFVRVDKVPDGLGGFVETEVEVSNVQCNLVPLKIDVALKEYGYHSDKLFKAFCIEKPKIPNDNAIALSGLDERYKLIQVLPLKRNILLLEKVNE